MIKYKIALVYLNNDYNVGMGVGYLATVIKNAGHDLTFFDTRYINMKNLTNDILTKEYDFLMISSGTLFYKKAIALSKEIKENKNNIKILLGGIHATILKDKLLLDCPYIDYLCIGEGEDFVIDFLNTYGTENFINTQNLGYRNKNNVPTINSIRPCTSLDNLPFLDWSLFNKASIINSGPLPGFCYVFATRGCPYNCTYCCNSFWLELYKKSYLRRKPIDSVISELVFLKNNYPVQTFYFADEMILLDMAYTSELLVRVKEEIDLPYGCMARVEKITPEVIELFSKTNCQYVGMGIECGDENFRKTFLNRHMSNDQIIYAYSELKKVKNLKTSSYNMKGYPVEYDDELTQKTLDLNAKVNPDFVGMSVFYPFPGTKLYDYCVANDKIDWDKFNNVTEYYTGSVLKR